MQRRLLNLCNFILRLCVALTLIVTVAYCFYSIWDNNSIYAAEESFMAQVQELKPQETEEAPSFEDLLAVNDDVCGWVTLPGTNIDTPIVQGKDNAEYLNKNVYGDFALSGCPFLDVRNSKDFSDAYSIVYGHHMDRHQMFGDLDLYLEESFFRAHTTGTLMVPGKRYTLTILAVLSVDAADQNIYDTAGDMTRRYAYLQANSTWKNDTLLEEAQEENRRILVLSTCSSENENGRVVLVCSCS